MKRFTLLIVSLIVSVAIHAQITLETSYTGNKVRLLDKLHVSGYKYVEVDIPNLTIKLYNLNHTLYKTMSVPTQTVPVWRITHISENLFDTDNFIEYVVVNASPSPPPLHYEFKVYKESGVQVFYRDSAFFGYTVANSSIFDYDSQIYYDGVNTKMKLTIASGVTVKTEVYNLGGSIPCSLCSASGTVMGVSGNSGGFENDKASFYPNPVTDQLKLKYQLPADYKTAGIKIYDTQGKLLEDFQITDSFDYIYLPSSYDNGLYFYSLIVDDQVIKTEKIILSK